MHIYISLSSERCSEIVKKMLTVIKVDYIQQHQHVMHENATLKALHIHKLHTTTLTAVIK